MSDTEPSGAVAAGVGIALDPRLDPRSGLTGRLRQVRAAMAAGSQMLLLGDKHTDEPVLRSSGLLLGRMLADVPADRQVGRLYLVPDWPLHLLLRDVRTLVELAEAAGQEPFVVLALGRASEALPPRAAAGGRVDRYVAGLDAIAGDAVAGRAERWIAAEGEPALRRAGARAHTWLANARHPVDELDRQRRIVVEAAVGRDGPPRSAVRRDLVCAPTDAEAERIAAAALAAGYRRGTVPRDALVVGSPASCLEQVEQLRQRGFDRLLLRPVAGGDEAEATMTRFLAAVTGREDAR